MNMLVFVKRVPDTESRIRIQQNAVAEDGLNFVASPYDEYAVEEALRLKEAKGGAVRVVSVGRDEAVAVLRKCLAMGADEAFLIKDESPETYDGLRTARIIARAVERRFAGADLLLFGRQSIGADNGQVPAMVAELLGLPQATVVTKLEVGDGTAVAFREIEGGTEKVELALPAVVTAQKGLNEPRYETLKGIMAAKKKEIPVVSLADLGFGPDDLAPTVEVRALDLPPARKAGRVLQGDPAEAARDLVRLLRDEAKVI
ncbi:MAG: electron transfer flavoprotein subunit beta/FixA family protein [Candidatus Aminicenantes bacterium]|nr:electron transfer flavoprotein subunit beta/FixA family protein [Candidatus Aminicenantes bacterium]